MASAASAVKQDRIETQSGLQGVAMRTVGVLRIFALLLTVPLAVAGVLAQDTESSQTTAERAVDPFVRTAPVVIDGRANFSVHGIASYPVDRRADDVAGRIRALARDPSFDPSTLEISHEALYSRIGSPGGPVLRVTDADAEEADRRLFAELCLGRVREAVVAYRALRTREALVSSAFCACSGH